MTVTRIVLQGEFAAVNADQNPHTLIKTSKATTCNVVVLSHPNHKIGVLAHFDDYTSVIHGFHKIDKYCKNNFALSIQNSGFEAQLYGGLKEDFYSLKQRELIKNTLRTAYKIHYSNISQLFPTQLLFDPQDESVMFLINKKPCLGNNATKKRIETIREGKKKNAWLEALQRREFYEWNRMLDRQYPGVKGTDIPEFKIKEASRFEHELPIMSEFDLKTHQQALAKLYPLEHISKINTIDKLELVKEVQLDIRPERKLAIQKTKKEVLQKIRSMIVSIDISPKDKTLLNNSLNSKNYNLSLRLAAADPRSFNIFKYLLKKKDLLKIDVNARGQKSGTALDIAQKHNNAPAVELLIQH